MSKIKTFLAAIEQGKTKDKAIALSGASQATASIQLAKWKKAKAFQEPVKVSEDTNDADIDNEDDEDDIEIVKE